MKEANGSHDDLTESERQELRQLVRGIVVAQGNVFIKELLRDRGLQIGVTKTDFERHLLAAIDSGDLSRHDLEDWLDEIEGWGDQHIYLYNVPEAIARDEVWQDSQAVRAKVEAAGLGELWNARTSQAFPATMTLSGIHFDGTMLRLTWHRAADSWVRTPSKDETREIEGDLYEFRAFRFRAKRAVTRFALWLGADDSASWLAAVLIPVAINSPEHEEILTQVDETLERLLDLFDFDDLREESVSIANVIRNLDQAALATTGGGPRVTAQATRLLSEGSYVEFGAVSSTDDYRNSDPVRRVRRTIRSPQLPSFTGSSGKLHFLADEAEGLSRDVKVQLYGEDRRVRIWRQLSATEVLTILESLRSHQ